MAKFLHDDAIDALLNEIADNVDWITICSAEPTTYTEAYTTYKLADVEVDEGDGNGDFTVGDGDTSGRKLDIAQQSSVPIDTTGTGTHIALVDTGNTKLILVTTMSSQALTSGGTVTIPSFKIEVADPS